MLKFNLVAGHIKSGFTVGQMRLSPLLYKRRSDALKWILVRAFGYLGFRKAKFGSREAILKVVRVTEEMGFEVIHGIVDSLWIRGEDASSAPIGSRERRICRLAMRPIQMDSVPPIQNQ